MIAAADTDSPDPYVARDLPLDTVAAACRCNGYADKTADGPTAEEIARYDCGRGWACCTAAFRCRLCGLRFIGTLQAPDLE